MDEAPIELLAMDRPHRGVIAARREGEPSFRWVQDIGDAVQAATARGVDLVISAELVAALRASGDLPPDWLPSCIVVT
jgi:hypothetical protein